MKKSLQAFKLHLQLPCFIHNPVISPTNSIAISRSGTETNSELEAKSFQKLRKISSWGFVGLFVLLWDFLARSQVSKQS